MPTSISFPKEYVNFFTRQKKAAKAAADIQAKAVLLRYFFIFVISFYIISILFGFYY